VWILVRERPSVVFAPNPSLVLTYLLLAYRPLLRYRFVSDAHYGGVVSVTGDARIQRLLDRAHRRADLVIVTNESHAQRIRATGGKAFVCPDPLPQLTASATSPAALNGAGKSVLFICSFDYDEPYQAVFDAARILSEQGFRVFVSGSYARVGLTPADAPHVTLLGYVDRATYEGFLRHVDVVLDLTTWQDCLVCGAYEAMAATKPAVLSETRSLTTLFTHGTVFTSHEPVAIANAVIAAYGRRAELSAQIPAWLVKHENDLRRRAAELRQTLRLAPS
jgi:glycosyltransferase involved in cell wall biosynthesis